MECSDPSPTALTRAAVGNSRVVLSTLPAPCGIRVLFHAEQEFLSPGP